MDLSRRHASTGIAGIKGAPLWIRVFAWCWLHSFSVLVLSGSAAHQVSRQYGPFKAMSPKMTPQKTIVCASVHELSPDINGGSTTFISMLDTN